MPQLEVASAACADADGGGAAFAPISYIVEGNALSDADDAIAVLLGALVGAGRVDSSHVFTLDIDNYLHWPTHAEACEFNTYLNHQLIRAIEGNVLVVRYGALEGEMGYDMTAYALFTRLLGLIEDAQCKTQVFFSVPEGKKDLVMRLRRRYNKPIVVISKDRGSQLSDDGADDGQGRAPSVEDLSLLLAEDFIWEGEGSASGRTVGFAA